MEQKRTDTLTRALLFDGAVSVTAINSKRMVNRAIALHGLSPVCAAALGRTMTVTAVLASEPKGEKDKLTVSIKGGGPIGSVTVSCDKALNVRGCVSEPALELPLNAQGKLDVGGAVGREGDVTVVKDLGLKEPYVGRCRLVSGEIGEDFAQYFTESEQQPSAVALGVLVDKPRRRDRTCTCVFAGGFVIRILPFCPEEVIDKLEKKLAEFSQVSAMFRDKTAEEFLRAYFPDCGLGILETLTPRYHCKCTKRGVEKLLHTLKYEELKDIVREDGKVEIHCHFCNRRYQFFDADIDRIFKK